MFPVKQIIYIYIYIYIYVYILLLPRVAQPVIRFRGQLLFHVGPGKFGQLFFP